MPSYVYILVSKKNGTLYIGITSDLAKRVYEHKTKTHQGFTSRYNVNKLVYYEVFDDIEFAIKRETQIKKWDRAWKVQKIMENNPEWDDWYEKLNN
jgi:putative endonuclease